MTHMCGQLAIHDSSSVVCNKITIVFQTLSINRNELVNINNSYFNTNVPPNIESSVIKDRSNICISLQTLSF